MRLNELVANLSFWACLATGVYFAVQKGYSLWLAVPLLFVASALVAVVVSWLLSRFN
ncbi:MAG: hypothetical protein IPP76_08195 [Moraxellaceae bacterium]|nr:hypothetical protein [Moraxellaceae bacterium]